LHNSTVDFNNAILYMNLSAEGYLPNTNTPTTFTHENYLHPSPFSTANLVDPGIHLTHSNPTKTFTVEATTGIAIWTWLDHQAGTLLNFDSNGFVLLPGRPMEVGYTVKSDGTGGRWVGEVTVGSLWDNTLVG